MMSDMDIERIGETVGLNVRYLMHHNHISQKRLADMIGVTSKTIQRICDGSGAGTRLWLMVSIANVFGVSIDELYKEEMVYE